MTTNTSYTLSGESQRLLTDFVKARYLSFNIKSARSRFEKIDQGIQLENVERRKLVEHYYDDTEIAVVTEPVNTATSFLTSIYLAKPEVFEVVTKDKEAMGVATQINTLNQENAKATNWERELPLYFRDCVKYDFGAIEVEWTPEQLLMVDTGEGGGSASTTSTKLREGNDISRRDPYNCFYDTTVPINEVHKRGEFSGYIERITMIDLSMRLEQMQLSGEGTSKNPVMNKELAMQSKLNGTSNQYYIPNIRTEYETSNELSTNSMTGFFGRGSMASDNKTKGFTSNRYELVTVYVRIIPSMFKMYGIPASTKPQIWKLKILNWDTLILAERQSNAHNLFGLINTQVMEEGLQSQNKSIAELLIPIQNLSTKLHDARMQSLKRNISDRAIYVQGAIDKSAIDTNNPAAKIPMRPSILVKSPRDAYFPIPFNDNLGATVLQELGYLERLADKTSGTNAPQRGQFQKGNKTLGEFSEIMQNADANMKAMALLLEASSMSPMKTMIMTNIMQYAPPQELTSPDATSKVQIDPVAIRKASMNFKVADGLRTKESLLGVDGLTTFMNMVMQMPELNAKYDIAEVVAYMFEVEGINIAQFERPQQPMQQGTPPQAQPPQAPPQPPQG